MATQNSNQLLSNKEDLDEPPEQLEEKDESERLRLAERQREMEEIQRKISALQLEMEPVQKQVLKLRMQLGAEQSSYNTLRSSCLFHEQQAGYLTEQYNSLVAETSRNAELDRKAVMQAVFARQGLEERLGEREREVSELETALKETAEGAQRACEETLREVERLKAALLQNERETASRTLQLKNATSARLGQLDEEMVCAMRESAQATKALQDLSGKAAKAACEIEQLGAKIQALRERQEQRKNVCVRLEENDVEERVSQKVQEYESLQTRAQQQQARLKSELVTLKNHTQALKTQPAQIAEEQLRLDIEEQNIKSDIELSAHRRAELERTLEELRAQLSRDQAQQRTLQLQKIVLYNNTQIQHFAQMQPRPPSNAAARKKTAHGSRPVSIASQIRAIQFQQ